MGNMSEHVSSSLQNTAAAKSITSPGVIGIDNRKFNFERM